MVICSRGCHERSHNPRPFVLDRLLVCLRALSGVAMKPVTAIFTLAILTGCGVELSPDQAERVDACIDRIPSVIHKDLAIATGRCKASTYLQLLIAENLK